MNKYSFKILELISLYKSTSEYYLKAKMVLQDEIVRIELEMDQETYEQIQQFIILEEKARFRISLRPKLDPFQHKYIGVMTKTSKSIVESYHFYCSRKFVSIINQLNLIETTTDLARIKNLKYEIETKKKKTSVKAVKHPPIKVFDRQAIKLLAPYAKPVSVIGLALVLFFITFQSLIPLFADNAIKGIQASVNGQYVMVSEKKSESVKGKIEGDSEFLHQLKERTRDVNGIFEIETTSINSLPEGYAAITIADGPSKYTKEIVDILVAHNVKATFFFTGKNSLLFSEEVQYARNQQMAVGLHSLDHKDQTTISSQEQLEDLQLGIDALT